MITDLDGIEIANIQRDGLDRYWGLRVFSTLRSMPSLPSDDFILVCLSAS
nr:MAG TPA: hypothetical protein [Bacteriophage sp.]